MLTVFEGEDAIFTCSPLIPIAVPLLEQDEFIVTGDSHPRISFVDNAGSGQTQGNRTYTLRDVERSDNGTRFRCSVAGSRSDAITLTVYSKYRMIYDALHNYTITILVVHTCTSTTIHDALR